MRLRKGITNLMKLNRYTFCNNQNKDKEEQVKENKLFKFLKDGWKQTFPNDEEQIKNKYKKVKEIKRFTEEELAAMQADIPEYQRTSLVETQAKAEEEKKKFKISSLIPESIRKKVEETPTYKEYSHFKDNLKEYVDTSDSLAVNVGNKAVRAVSGPSKSARAIDVMRQYDKDFNLLELEKESTFIFRDAYHHYLEGNLEELEKLCGDQGYALFKSMIQMYETKKARPKFTELIFYSDADLKQTFVADNNSLPSFAFDIRIMDIYCLVDPEGKIVDGDEERIMSSSYRFVLKYSGEHIAELGHPWQITEIHKFDEVKLLV